MAETGCCKFIPFKSSLPFVPPGNALKAQTLRDMQTSSFPFVHWGALSKYALFMWELTDPLDMRVHIRAEGVPGAKRLEWVSREDLHRQVLRGI